LLAPVPYILKDQQFWLTAERCLYWEAEKALIVSDLHFGKTGHFRKSGIAVPTDVYKEDLQRLWQQIQYFKPDSLIIVGDLFHSRANLEHSWFKRWRQDMPMVDMHLVIGNHDILHPDDYSDMGLTVHNHEHSIEGLWKTGIIFQDIFTLVSGFPAWVSRLYAFLVSTLLQSLQYSPHFQGSQVFR
jgi:metallophosphoesterase superfamily enzyme